MEPTISSRIVIHLPNALHMRYEEVDEKMVDSALAADVVSTANREVGDWIVVVTEDDDLFLPST